MFYIAVAVAYVWSHATDAANTAHNNKCCAAQYKVLNGPQLAEAHHLAQCYSLNNWISHWCKVSSFQWTTLMQDTLDITGAGYEYEFIWLDTG